MTGYVLGPILFLLFINDLVLDIESNIKLFADDTNIYNSFNNIDILQEDLNKLVLWSAKWLLSFHIDNCRVINYGNNNVTHSYLMDAKLVLNTY